jgi:O-succinylbenzoate synthase
MKYLFQFRRYRLPFRAPVRTAQGIWAEREGLIVRLESETGVVGHGEAAVIPWFGTETVEDAEGACRELSGRVDDSRLASVPERLVCLRNALGAARRAVGKAEEEADPERRVEDNAPYLGVASLLPAGRAALTAMGPKAEAGYRVFKWKVGVGDLADELALLDDVCAALPNGGKLRLDANGAWDRRKSERWLERCAGCPVEFVEQPIAAESRGARDVLQGLAGDYPTPIALDESLVSDGDVERWIGAGWPGIFVVKSSLFADPHGALTRLAAAKADVVFSSALETAIGARAALEMAFAWTTWLENNHGSTRKNADEKAKSGTSKPQGSERALSRALGFGVWPLFADARFDAPFVTPFIRREDVERLNAGAVWNALS